jgi:hypothetical protein
MFLNGEMQKSGHHLGAVVNEMLICELAVVILCILFLVEKIQLGRACYILSNHTTTVQASGRYYLVVHGACPGH